MLLRVLDDDLRQPEELVKELRNLPDGAVAVIAGHSNTVPDLVQRLGGKPTGLEEHPKHGWLLAHDEYSRMFVVTLHRPAGQADAPGNFTGCLELRYGAP